MRVSLAALALLAGLAAARAQQPPLPESPPPEAAPVPEPAAPPAAPAPGEPGFVASLPEAATGVPGTWDLSRDGTNRRCVMTLTGDSGEAGRRLRFPAGCRKALPVLNGVAGWLFADAAVRLVDRDLRPVLSFARRPDQRSLLARSEAGEPYSLVPLQIAAMRPPEPAPAAPPAPSPAAAAEPAPAGPRPEPGIYALDRYNDREVCRLALGPPEGANAPVRVLDGCRDSGIAIFDPASWRYVAGRLVLSARRGHVVNLVPTGTGGWRRDPETGVTFILRRVE
ncbi:AprI/Inh family metalloprotease inhibitor [Methylobacterium sp. A54F]